MSVKVEKIGTNKAKFIIEIDNATFRAAEDKVFNKEKGKLSAPGFRKGKVTKDMAYKVYGQNAFLEEAINQCINDTYYNSVKESGEKVLSDPKIEVKQADLSKSFIYEATAAIIPEVKLGNYKGIALDKTKIELKDKEIDDRIKEEQEKNARLVSVERKSKNGDILNIDFDGYVDGKQFQGGKADHYQLTLGSHSFIDNFEDQLIDKNVNDDVEVNVKFPENYGEKTLAGKAALFKVHINEIKEKQLPEINDEFVSEISEFDKLSDYKEHIKKELTEIHEKRAKETDKNRVLEEVAKNTTIELAPEAIEAQIDEMVYNYSNRMQYQGFTFDKYLEMSGKTMEQFRDAQKPIAERNLKNSIILEQIAKDEKIEASDEMVDEELTNMAKSYGMEVEQFKKAYASEGDMKRLKDELLYPAVIDFLYNNAKLK